MYYIIVMCMRVRMVYVYYIQLYSVTEYTINTKIIIK